MYTNGKTIIEQDFNGLHIINPSSNSLFAILFLIFWLCLWCVGEVTAIQTLIKNGSEINFFILFWVCGWTLGGFFVARQVLWGLFGKETLHLTNQELCLKDSILGFGKTHTLPTFEITSIELNTPQNIDKEKHPGNILFQHGFKTYSFGVDLGTHEATYIIGLIQKKLPHVEIKKPYTGIYEPK